LARFFDTLADPKSTYFRFR